MALTLALGAPAVLGIAGLGDAASIAIVLAALAIAAGVGRAALTIRRAAVQSERHHRSLTDAVTDLPNREAFLQALEAAVADAAGTNEGFAVLVLDLDDFEELNDALLAQLGTRLASAGAGRALVARLGDDEFAALVRRPTEGRKDDRPLAVAAALLRAVREPFLVDGIELALDASVGIALYPEHVVDGQGLLRMAADVAKDKTKRDQSSPSVNRRESDHQTRQRRAVAAQLKQGIERRELVVQYQPQVDVTTGTVRGFESLVRWRRDGVMVPPASFLAAAERSGLMPAITAAVLDEVLSHQRRQGDGDARPVAINLSAADLRNPDLVEKISDRLVRRGVAPGLLQVEVAEHVLMRDPHYANTVLQGLRAIGVKVVLDGFGTGHSSLSSVQRLGLDALKIDRRFVTDMCEVRGNALVVGVAIDLARSFGLEVIAQGVETLEVAAALANRGCDIVQGHWISPPLSAAELATWLGRHAERGWAA